MASSKPTRGVAVGRYALNVAGPAGTLILPGPLIADDTAVETPAELADALKKDERQTVGQRFERATMAAEEVTSRLEEADRLLQSALDGSLWELDHLLAHVGEMLDVFDSLDRDGRWDEWLRYARAINSLLALAKRWATLVRSLGTALSAAERAPELKAAVAWAQHELGTLHLAVEDAVGAKRRLETARRIRESLDDREGLAATEQSLSILCRQQARAGSRMSRRVLVAAVLLLLLLAGGVALAVVNPFDDADESGGGGGGGGSSSKEIVPDTVTVTVRTAGDGEGRVTSRSGIDCPSKCRISVERGARIELSAAAVGDAIFTGWRGGCAGAGRCALGVVAAVRITARFRAAPPDEPTLTVIPKGRGGGTVTSTRQGISCGPTCVAPFAQGEAVRLTQVADDGSDFAGWKGAGCSGTEDCPVKLDEPQEVTATFDLQPTTDVTLTTSVDDGSGRITATTGSDPKVQDCSTPGCPYPKDTVVTLTAVPGPGMNTVTWDGCDPEEDRARCEVTMSADRKVSVVFGFREG
jgi:hypothetical protein